MASCESIGSLLQAFSDEQLDLETQALVQQHLGGCTVCCKKQFEIKKGMSLLHRALSADRLPAGFSERVANRLFGHEGYGWLTAKEYAIRKRIAQSRRARGRWLFPLVASACLVFFFSMIFMFWRASSPMSVASLAPDLPSVGSVAKMEGQPEIEVIEAGNYRKVPFGYGIYPGSRLATNNGSLVAFVMEDQTTVMMNKDTVLNVKGSRSLKLEKGEIMVEVTRHLDNRTFEIDIPTGKIIVTGTRFYVRAGVLETLVHLIEGKLAVIGSEGEILPLNAGESARVRASGPPERIRVEQTEAQVKWAKDLGVPAVQSARLLAYDDGSPEGSLALGEGKAAWVTFRTEEPCTLRNLWLYGRVYSTDWRSGTLGRTFDIIVYDQDMNPVTPEVVRSYGVLKNELGWTWIDLPPIEVNGLFHVAVRPRSDGRAGLVLATDDDAIGDHYRIASFGTEGMRLSDRSPKWMVRTVVKPKSELN